MSLERSFWNHFVGGAPGMCSVESSGSPMVFCRLNHEFQWKQEEREDPDARAWSGKSCSPAGRDSGEQGPKCNSKELEWDLEILLDLGKKQCSLT